MRTAARVPRSGSVRSTLVVKGADELSLSDWVVLAVVAEGPTHGWPVVRILRADGAIGRIWTVARPIVYRSLTTLTTAGYVEPCGEVPGVRGPQRTLVRVTRRGRAALNRWLAAPVEHVRDVRSEFLVKLALLDRAGKPALPLITKQREALVPVVRAVSAGTRTSGFDAVLVTWRREQARAVDRFLHALERDR